MQRATPGRRARRRAPLLALVCWPGLVAPLTGCATYSEKLADARLAATSGAYGPAIERVNDLAGVDSVEALPEDWNSTTALATLERAVLLQATRVWPLSARDLSAAENELEVLDIARDPVGTLAKVLYSESAQVYHASPVERLCVNGFNMLNYLAEGDLSGAAVEARRFQVMRDYLVTLGDAPRAGFGAYLAGFVFEQMGEGDRALRYYEETLAEDRLASLDAPIARLAALSEFRGPGIDAVLEREGARRSAPRPGGEVLVVVAPGRVPYKRPERLPVGLAIGIASTWFTGDTDILERSALKVVVYPELARDSAVVRGAEVAIDGEAAAVDLLSDLAGAVEREYEALKPRLVAAALSRLLARAAVAEGTRAAVGSSGADSVWSTLAALVVEGALVSLDEPDTRSWTFLPARVYAARARLAPGTHEVRVRIAGLAEEQVIPVSVADGGWAVVVVTEPR